MVTRLANAFVSLCEAGDVKSLHWKTTMRCDIQNAMKTGFEEHFAEMKKEILVLENRLKEWKENLTAFRQNNPLMNYFTVKQSLVLQKQLYLLSKDLSKANYLPSQVFTLLKYIIADVSAGRIKNAFYLSSVLDDSNNNSEDWKKAKSDQPTNFTEYGFHQLHAFIDMLQDECGIEENVALASLIRCNPFIKGKAIIWCSKQSPESDLIDDLADQAEQELKKLKEMSKHDAIEVDSEESDDIVVAPFISLDQFGRFLKELAGMTGIYVLYRYICTQYISLTYKST